MKISSVGYSVRQGFKNIRRNRMFSIASVATISACIFLFGIFFAMLMNFRNMFQEFEKNLCVTVFFDEGITEEQIAQLGEQIRVREEVDNVHFTSAEEAWNDYQIDYFKGYEEARDTFGDDNPLMDSSSYEIYLSDASKQVALVEFLNTLEGIRSVYYSASTADNLTDIAVIIGYVSVVIIAILLAVSVFLISNTVAIGVTVRKEEISIMKLIGATDSFVKAPFVVEGVTIGLLGSLIPLLIIYFAYEYVVSYVSSRFGLFGNASWFLGVNDIYIYLLPIAVVLGIGIGFVGSHITLRKHVRI